MTNKRTAALTIGAVILIGGGATALATTTNASTHRRVETATSTLETRSTDTVARTTDTAAESEYASIDHSAGALELPPTSDPSTTEATNLSRAAEEDAGVSDRIAGPSAPFGTMSTVPPDWNGLDDPGADSSDDAPGSPLDLKNLTIDSLVSLARAAGITVGDSISADDGSITFSITLPDTSEHTVRVAVDENNHITDATVDDIPIAEFVSSFLQGDFNTPRTTLPTIPPDWQLPD